MKTIKIDLDHPDIDLLDQAVQALKDDQIIIYPSGTAYSLATNALKSHLVERVYQTKGRSQTQPIHVIARDWVMAEELIYPTEEAKFLWERFLPGPLTLVLRKKAIVPDILTSGLPTLGIRFPNFQITHFLSAAVDFPYTSTSANPSGMKTPYSLKEVCAQFSPKKLSQITLAIDVGKISPVSPSTVIDLTTHPPALIREGPITRQELERILGKLA